MPKVKVFMLGNAMVDGEQYVKDDEYEVTSYTYRALGTSCILSSKKPRYAVRIGQQKKKNQGALENKIKIVPKRFLVIKTQGIGNVINITPAIRKIHELFPECKIDFLCDDDKKDMLKGWKILNKIYEYPADIDKVKEQVYDCALVGCPGHGDEAIFQAFRAKYLLKPNQRALMIQHEAVVNMEPLIYVGWNGVNIPDSYIPISAQMRRKVKGIFKGRKYIAICAGFFPSEQWARKNWGYENYAKLVRSLLRRYKGHKVIVMGTGEDRCVFDYLKKTARIIDAVGKYSINESAAILERCKFLVTNDTGLSHVGGAVGCHVFTIFGATSIIKNHPWRNSTVIHLGLDCAPCQFTQRWGSCDKWECLEIKPSEVMQFIKPEKKTAVKYELAVIMANHDRYSLALPCFNSLIHCEGIKDVKFILIDDNSEPRTSKLLKDFKLWHGNTEIIRHEKTYGRDKYHDTINQGLALASDCKYVMFMPDDGLYNPWLFEVCKKSYKYLTNQIKCITYWKDDRPSGRGKELACGYNNHFDVIKYVDGFMCLFSREYLEGLEIHGRTSPGGSSIWWNIQLQMRTHAHKILCYKETLAEHIGNIESSMHPEARKRLKIFAKDLNLWGKPKILRGN